MSSDIQASIVLARRLRRDMTTAERRLWSRLRDQQLGVKFRRQHILRPYILDFACIPLKIAVEADGGQHGSSRDERRDAFLGRTDWHVLRFWNNDILANTDGVVAAILAEIAHRRTTPTPALPRFAGEGEDAPSPSPAERGRAGVGAAVQPGTLHQ